MTLAALRTAAPLAGRFPRPAYALARFAGWLTWKLRAGARARVEGNLLPACGGDRERASAAALTVFQSVARYYVDLAIVPAIATTRASSGRICGSRARSACPPCSNQGR